MKTHHFWNLLFFFDNPEDCKNDFNKVLAPILYIDSEVSAVSII